MAKLNNVYAVINHGTTQERHILIKDVTELLTAVAERYQTENSKGALRTITPTETNFKKVVGGEEYLELIKKAYTCISKMYTFRNPQSGFNNRDVKRLNSACKKLEESIYTCGIPALTIKALVESSYSQGMASDNAHTKSGAELSEVGWNAFLKAFCLKLGKEICDNTADLRKIKTSATSDKIRGAEWIAEYEKLNNKKNN